MNYKYLGKTGILVSEIGFGTWGIGGATEGASSYGQTDDRESIRALETALEQGVTFFDTATAYGRSEEILGQVLKGSKRKQAVIATKVGITKHYSPPDFSRTAITASLQNSLKRLQTDFVDLCQLYNPPLTDSSISEIWGTLEEFKRQGLIRAIGASVKSPADGLPALLFPEIKVIQTNLSMLDQRAIDNGLLKVAEQKGVGIIARTPLCFGFLSGTIVNLDFGPQDHRSQWPRKQLEAWQKGAKLLSELNPYVNRSLSQLALRFCLDNRGVNTVIPGPMNIKEVLENAAASKLPHLDPETTGRIRKTYHDNSQFFVKPD